VTGPADTVAACLSPPGQSALCSIGVHGPRAWQFVRDTFRPRSGKPLPEAPPQGSHRLGLLGEQLSDEVVVAVKEISPVPFIEITGHGGREVVRLLLEQLAARGVRVVGWPELLARTAEPLRAAAAVALASAPTVRTAAILLDQHAGALGRALDEVLAAKEAEAGRLLEQLAGRAPLGRHLTTPWRVVVAGPPNVGKSSLVNALAGYQRSAVSPLPGTTRDVVTTTLALDGWPVEIADTAGMRQPGEALESEGIGLARRSAAEADLCLWLLDASGEPVWPEPASNVRLVINKCDLPSAWDLDRAGAALRVSATTGAGIAELCAILGRWLVPDPPAPGAAVPFTPALAGVVEEAVALWRAGQGTRAKERLRRLRDTPL
jgi:tRNA modification GTPase